MGGLANGAAAHEDHGEKLEKDVIDEKVHEEETKPAGGVHTPTPPPTKPPRFVTGGIIGRKPQG